MSTKEEWKEYFRLVNDREPSPNDLKVALQKGEISDSVTSTAASRERQKQSPSYKTTDKKRQSANQSRNLRTGIGFLAVGIIAGWYRLSYMAGFGAVSAAAIGGIIGGIYYLYRYFSNDNS